jgi:hypothetical protein
VLKSEGRLFNFGPQRDEMGGRHARLHHRNRRVNEFTELRASIALPDRGAAHRDGTVVTSSVAVETLRDVEEGGAAR